MKFLCTALTLLLCTCVSAQNPTGKAITVDDMRDWNRLTNEQISPTGHHILYTLTKDVGDPTTILYNTQTGHERRFPRLHQAQLSYDGRHLLGLLKPSRDTVRQIKLTDKEKASKKLATMDTLVVWDLSAPQPLLIPGAHNYQLPERNARSYAYTTNSSLPDSLTKDLDDKARRLVVRNFATRDSFYLEGVMNYSFARDAPILLATRTDKDSTWQAGIHRLDTRELRWHPLLQDSLDFKQATLSNDGTHVAFLSRPQDPDDDQAPYQLHYWTTQQNQLNTAHLAPSFAQNNVAPSGHRDLAFTPIGDYLLFGAANRIPERDTNLLDNEIANVEVWTTDDARLYTQENVRLDDTKKATYLAALNLATGTTRLLGNSNRPYAYTPHENDGPYVAVFDDRPYAKETTWEGFPGARNTTIINLETGQRQEMLTGSVTPARFLEGGNYLVWYNQADTTWNSFNPATSRHHVLTTNTTGTFYDELNDRPMHPYAYGYAGTLKGGQKFLVNDRYDIWELDANGTTPPRRLTRGREKQTRYRLRDLNPEERFIDPTQRQLVTVFDQGTYDGGFGWLDLANGTVEVIRNGAKTYGDFLKARQADAYVYSESDFRQFPDLIFAENLKGSGQTISHANPQQADFRWGSAETYEWVDNQGRTLRGLLVKPDGFDPSKKYPLLVNFYERSSEEVNSHSVPVPGRSSINYAHYVSKGYVIFNPDVIYRIGYPGESAYDCVMSGVTSLLGEGFIDRERIGAQGHSWGGYQVAYLATRTDLFQAIESGAPVVNMFSAYGGIRWRTGLSRQFQYERTQSRIGGSPWEYPLRYIENSPIFTADKINTPILILHNDADGAVPWFQGIEFYTALRRLDKKAWLLNYRGEPHWPLKKPNRADFQTRMEQFFDHYLLDAPMPAWMKHGVRPIDRGINQGLELLEDGE